MYPMRALTASGSRATSAPATTAVPSVGVRAPEHADQRRLAGDVRSHQREELSSCHGEVQMINGNQRAEPPGQPKAADGGAVAGRGPIYGSDHANPLTLRPSPLGRGKYGWALPRPPLWTAACT